MKEIQDLFDALPYWLLIVLPVFIALSPYNPVCDASEINFPIHRLAQYEISGNRFGSKTAALSIEARAASTAPSNLLRKVVITKVQDVSVAKVNEMITAGAGGILFLIPKSLSEEAREAAQALEEYLVSTEIEVPIYFAEENDELDRLVDDLQGLSSEKSSSAAQALFSSIASNGYQMVTSTSGTPRALTDILQTSIEGSMKGNNEGGQTVVVVAHYDSNGAAPGISFGADSNGSGVTIILELARLFGKLFGDSKTRPPLNLVFLISAGGKWNFFGTKKWLEDHLDQNANSDLLSDVAFAVCLDSLGGGNGRSQLHMHVSKPPKEDTPAGKFHANLQAISNQVRGVKAGEVKMVHKKINLADEILAWEHERFSIRRISALTLSMMSKPNDPDRATIFDNSVNPKVIADNTKIIAEALLCTLYESKTCTGQFFVGSLVPDTKSIESWSNYFSKTPRHSGLVTSGPIAKKSNSEPGIVDLLGQTLYNYAADIRYIKSKPDKQDPEFIFFDLETDLTMSAHRVKPAVFDLILTCVIASYLGLVYLFIMKSGVVVSYLSNLSASRSCHSSPAKTNGTYTNGNHKVKAN